MGNNDDYFISRTSYDSSFFVGGEEENGLLRGRVEYCQNGTFHGICYDESWNTRDAIVVCQQLGFAPHGKKNHLFRNVINLMSIESKSMVKFTQEC